MATATVVGVSGHRSVLRPCSCRISGVAMGRERWAKSGGPSAGAPEFQAK